METSIDRLRGSKIAKGPVGQFKNALLGPSEWLRLLKKDSIQKIMTSFYLFRIFHTSRTLPWRARAGRWSPWACWWVAAWAGARSRSGWWRRSGRTRRTEAPPHAPGRPPPRSGHRWTGKGRIRAKLVRFSVARWICLKIPRLHFELTRFVFKNLSFHGLFCCICVQNLIVHSTVKK